MKLFTVPFFPEICSDFCDNMFMGMGSQFLKIENWICTSSTIDLQLTHFRLQSS